MRKLLNIMVKIIFKIVNRSIKKKKKKRFVWILFILEQNKKEFQIYNIHQESFD